MKPPGSTGAIINYGNATSPFIGAPVAIENRIGVGAPTLGAPSLTHAPRMPILERITPRNVNAGKALGTAQARSVAIATRQMRRGVDTVTGYVNAIGMHVSQATRRA